MMDSWSVATHWTPTPASRHTGHHGISPDSGRAHAATIPTMPEAKDTDPDGTDGPLAAFVRSGGYLVKWLVLGPRDRRHRRTWRGRVLPSAQITPTYFLLGYLGELPHPDIRSTRAAIRDPPAFSGRGPFRWSRGERGPAVGTDRGPVRAGTRRPRHRPPRSRRCTPIPRAIRSRVVRGQSWWPVHSPSARAGPAAAKDPTAQISAGFGSLLARRLHNCPMTTVGFGGRSRHRLGYRRHLQRSAGRGGAGGINRLPQGPGLPRAVTGVHNTGGWPTRCAGRYWGSKRTVRLHRTRNTGSKTAGAAAVVRRARHRRGGGGLSVRAHLPRHGGVDPPPARRAGTQTHATAISASASSGSMRETKRSAAASDSGGSHG